VRMIIFKLNLDLIDHRCQEKTDFIYYSLFNLNKVYSNLDRKSLFSSESGYPIDKMNFLEFIQDSNDIHI